MAEWRSELGGSIGRLFCFIMSGHEQGTEPDTTAKACHSWLTLDKDVCGWEKRLSGGEKASHFVFCSRFIFGGGGGFLWLVYCTFGWIDIMSTRRRHHRRSSLPACLPACLPPPLVVHHPVGKGVVGILEISQIALCFSLPMTEFPVTTNPTKAP